MEDKVGSKIPTPQEIARLVKEVQAVGAKLSSYTIDLTTEARRRALKFRTGGEQVVALVGALATEHEVTLPKISVEGMTADLDLAQRLQPVANAVQVLAQTIADTILEAHSECWWAATAYYTTLARLADADAKLQAALRPAVAFFARGPRPAPAPEPPPPPPPAPSPVPPLVTGAKS